MNKSSKQQQKQNHQNGTSQNQYEQQLAMLKRVMSSNQQLLHSQMDQIKKVTLENITKQERISLLQKKYNSILEALDKEQKDIGFDSSSDDSSSVHSLSSLGPTGKYSHVESMVDKIAELQSQLTNTKVQLALKQEQMLNQQLRTSKIKVLKVNNSQDIEQYIGSPQKDNKNGVTNSFKKKNGSSTKKQKDHDLWIKVLESLSFKNKSKDLSDQQIRKVRKSINPLIKSFIPHELRKQVWPLLLENKVGINNSLYLELLNRREKGWVNEKVKIQIDKDITRSFFGKTQYEQKMGLISEIVQFLQIFHIYRPDISYIQGMTYPAVILIPIVGKIKAFSIFSNLIVGNQFFRKVYHLENNFVSLVCRAFEYLLKHYNRLAWQLLQEHKIQAEIYLIEWIFTFFSRGMSIETTLKFWDILLYQPQISFLKMALAVFELIGPYFQELQYEGVITFIREFANNISEQKLLEVVSSAKFKNQRISRVLERLEDGLFS